MINLPDRLQNKISPEPMSGCWIWTGALSTKGYGRYGIKNRTYAAHRVVFEIFREGIPENMQLDHLCRNRQCVNPDHLEIVSNRENTLRGINFIARNAKATHCPQGHEYNSDNTYLSKYISTISRRCKMCLRDRRIERYRSTGE